MGMGGKTAYVEDCAKMRMHQHCDDENHAEQHACVMIKIRACTMRDAETATQTIQRIMDRYNKGDTRKAEETFADT